MIPIIDSFPRSALDDVSPEEGRPQFSPNRRERRANMSAYRRSMKKVKKVFAKRGITFPSVSSAAQPTPVEEVASDIPPTEV